jgi:TonB family protein
MKPLLLALFSLLALGTQAQQGKPVFYPEYPGGDEQLAAYFAEYYQCQGTYAASATFRFSLDSLGTPYNISLGSPINAAADQEALRVFQSIPTFVLPEHFNHRQRQTYNATVFLDCDGGSQLKRQNLYDVVEQAPQFPGGDPVMLKFLQANINYPSEVAAKATGIVYVGFVVGSDGVIRAIRILKSGLGHGLEEEALRVMHAMPPWQPGRNEGKAVAVKFSIPISFKLGK